MVRTGGSSTSRPALAHVLRERTLLVDIAVGAVASTIVAVAPSFIFMTMRDRVLENQPNSTLDALVGVIVPTRLSAKSASAVECRRTELPIVRQKAPWGL